MISITQEEAMALRQKMPNAYIITTNKKSNHKKYYAEEAKAVREFIDNLRRKPTTEKG